MTQKYLKVNIDGNIAEELSKQQSQGAIDAGEVVALNGDGKIDWTMLPSEYLTEVAQCTAGEALSKGDIVYLYVDNGIVYCRKAKAIDVDTLARGFVRRDYTDGATDVRVTFEGTLVRDGASYTVGAPYFLSNSIAGEAVTPAPQGEGIIIQRVGTAISSTEIQFERQQPIIKPVLEADAGGAGNTTTNAFDGGSASDTQDTGIDGGTA